MQARLFRGLPTSQLLYTDTRLTHTSSLAAYVVATLPVDLEVCTAGRLSLQDLAIRHGQLLQDEAARIRGIASLREAREIQLDLVMLLGSYLLAKDQALALAPPILLELLKVNGAAHNLPKRMTYELIVDVNTECFIRSGGHIRAFAQGEIGRIERDFYIGHHFAEQHMRSSFESLRQLLLRGRGAALENRTAWLQSVLMGLQQFTDYMAAYARLPHKEYAYFRQFLRVYPDSVKNASGAFMPSPQLFELLLQPPAYAQTTYIQQNMQYFPIWAQPLLQEAITSRALPLDVRLHSAALQLSLTQRRLLAAIVEQFICFKLTHIRVASSKIPEAFPHPPVTGREDLRGFCPFLNAQRQGEGQQQGTGGFAPQDFLGDGVRRLLELQQRLTPQLGQSQRGEQFHPSSIHGRGGV